MMKRKQNTTLPKTFKTNKNKNETVNQNRIIELFFFFKFGVAPHGTLSYGRI